MEIYQLDEWEREDSNRRTRESGDLRICAEDHRLEGIYPSFIPLKGECSENKQSFSTYKTATKRILERHYVNRAD